MTNLPPRRRQTVEQWVVYWNPRDFPDQYVVRRWEIGPGVITPTEDVRAFDMLEEARMAIPDGFYRLERAPSDDATIVEVWV